MIQRQHEQTLNVWFAEILEGFGLNARPESMYPDGRIDVEVRIGQPEVKIALEAEHGQDAAKCVECAVVVCYPHGVNEVPIMSVQCI